LTIGGLIRPLDYIPNSDVKASTRWLKVGSACSTVRPEMSAVQTHLLCTSCRLHHFMDAARLRRAGSLRQGLAYHLHMYGPGAISLRRLQCITAHCLVSPMWEYSLSCASSVRAAVPPPRQCRIVVHSFGSIAAPDSCCLGLDTAHRPCATTRCSRQHPNPS
jgi:hypothetical protein